MNKKSNIKLLSALNAPFLHPQPKYILLTANYQVIRENASCSLGIHRVNQ